MSTLSGINISKGQYAELLITQERLNRLERGGVDNWEWYSESLYPDGEEDMDEFEDRINETYKD